MCKCHVTMCFFFFFFFKQKTAYEMRISDWSSDVCSSDLEGLRRPVPDPGGRDLRPPARTAAGQGRQRRPRREEGRHRLLAGARRAEAVRLAEIGRAAGRERVCQYV